jgi:simple sugar transport system substrate-binding protein
MDDDERQELVIDRRQMLKRAGLGAAALSVPAAVMATPAMGAVTDALAAESFIKSHPKWKFVFVNHAQRTRFWPPLLYGAEDACSVLGCSYQWTGSKTSTLARW